MKRIFFITAICLLLPYCSFAQLKDYSAEIETLKREQAFVASQLSRSKAKVDSLSLKVSVANDAIDSLQSRIESLESGVASTKNELSHDIANTNKNVESTAEELTKGQQYNLIFLVVCVAIVVALICLVNFLLRKRITTAEEEAVKLDQKLLDVIDKQLNLQQQQSKNISVGNNAPAAPDHSLALKVADEIVRIEMNLSRMDSSIKGYKQLSKAVLRIKDNFSAKGYEITEMLGQNYNEGMKVVPNFVTDESLPEGAQIITGIIKPQILFNGEMIQSAQITVSVNV